MGVGVKISKAKRQDPVNRELLRLVHKIDRNSRAAAKLASAKYAAAKAFHAEGGAFAQGPGHWERLQDVLDTLDGCLHVVLAEREGFRRALDREQKRLTELEAGR